MRILVKEVNWLGDLMISLPALLTIRRAYPDAHLSVLVRRELATFFDGFLAELTGDDSTSLKIDEVIPYTLERGVNGLRDRWRIATGLRKRGFDLAIVFPKSFDSALWPALARIPTRAGWQTDHRGILLTRKAPFVEGNGHQRQVYLDLLRATLGIESDAAGVHVAVAAKHAATAKKWLETRRRRPEARLIALAVAAAYGPAKEWPSERFAALIDLLSTRLGAESVLVGAPNERLKCERVAAASNTGALVGAGEMNIGETMALLALCDGFVGNDSGASHLAAGLALPTVAIFGSTDPARTEPLGPRVSIVYEKIECSPCLARTCRFGHYDCLRRIEAVEVAATLERLMSSRHQ